MKTWTYCKKNYDCTPNATVSLWFFIYVMGAIGNTLIIASISVCIYLFIFFKGQTIPYTLLPNISDEKNIQIFTIIGFCLKVSLCCTVLYKHNSKDGFSIQDDTKKSYNNIMPIHYSLFIISKLFHFTDCRNYGIHVPTLGHTYLFH